MAKRDPRAPSLDPELLLPLPELLLLFREACLRLSHDVGPRINFETDPKSLLAPESGPCCRVLFQFSCEKSNEKRVK